MGQATSSREGAAVATSLPSSVAHVLLAASWSSRASSSSSSSSSPFFSSWSFWPSSSSSSSSCSSSIWRLPAWPPAPSFSSSSSPPSFLPWPPRRAAATTVFAVMMVVFLAVLSPLAAAAEVTADALLDCAWDEEWTEFRKALQRNAEEDFPFDPDLVLQAQELLSKHAAGLDVDGDAAYGATPGMQSFFSACNAPPADWAPEPFCLYGVVAALWLAARSGHPDGKGLLSHAQFLLGKSMRHTLDFMEASTWPISSLDVFANLHRPEGSDFLLPNELDEYKLPPPVPYKEAGSARDARDEGTYRFVVWEVGVHATLSAEPLQMWARFIPEINLSHRNLIREQYPQWLPNKCKTLYDHPKLTCDTVEDEITDLFRARLPYSATSKDPIEDIDGFVAEFRALAQPKLRQVDVLLCTVAYLCLLYEDLGLPVLGYFGHPLLFMVPLDPAGPIRRQRGQGEEEEGLRPSFWKRFVAMASSPKVGFVVSDPFLQMQYDYQVGAPRLPIIRTHALYTGATHFPSRASEVLVLDRPHECVLMCIIQRLLSSGRFDPTAMNEGQKDHEQEETVSWPTSDGRLRSASSPNYPYSFLTRALTDRSFATFAQFRAVAIWAYDMDLITFYEFYSMNSPIFMPSHLPKYIFQQDHMDYAGQWSHRREAQGLPALWPDEPGMKRSPFHEGRLDSVKHTVKFSDYFVLPHVQYFESVADLLRKLPTTDFFEVSQQMARYNQDALVKSSNAWKALLRRTGGFDEELLQL